MSRQLQPYEAALNALLIALKAKRVYLELNRPSSFDSIQEINILSAQIEALQEAWELYMTTPRRDS